MPEAQDQTTLTADDLKMLDPALEDAGKTDEDLWDEMEPESEPSGQDASKSDNDAFLDDETEGKPDDAPADAGQSDGTPDIWANASPEQWEAFKETQKRILDLEHRLRSDDGRVSSLQRKINRLQEDLQNQQANSGNRNETATQALGRMKEEYPEIAELLDPVIGSVRGDITALSAAEKRRLETTHRDLQESTHELATIATNNAREVDSVHPGYEKFLAENGQAFARWVEDQPLAVRQAAYANAEFVADPAAAIDVINRFKAAFEPSAGGDPRPAGNQTPPNDRRRRQLDASASPSKSARRPATSGVPEDGDPQAIWDAFEAQESARR